MRILYHHRTQAEDAQGIHIRELIRSFRNLGHEVVEVSLVGSDQSSKGERHPIFHRLAGAMPDIGYEAMEMLYNPLGIARVTRAIKKFKPDFIYERYSLYNLAGVVAARRLRVPIIEEVNAPLALEKEQLGQLTMKSAARATERWICTNADRTLVVSTPLKKWLTELGVPADSVEVCPNGVDPHQFNDSISGESLRQSLGITGKQVLGFVGWIRPWHGLDQVVAAMGRWKSNRDDVHLLIVGDGPGRPLVEEAARASGVEDRVHLVGAVDRESVPMHIAAMDIALQPAAPEYACPMKIFEYLAMGKVVVAPQQENIEEILTEGVNAKLFRPGDHEHFVGAIEALAADPQGRERMGRQARQTIFERRFLWDENARRVAELARSLRQPESVPG